MTDTNDLDRLRCLRCGRPVTETDGYLDVPCPQCGGRCFTTDAAGEQLERALRPYIVPERIQ